MLTPIYRESLRPQFHFSPQKGWTNDPNGLVYFKGEFHLFFQHNPFGTEWGNMTWGHAVSKDLLHWTQLPSAIEPDALGTIFSGSAVVDSANTSGFGKKGQPALVCVYTAAGGTNPESKGVPFTQCLAYSLDGRTFAKFEGNPVLPHIAGENRDPKVIWHAPSKHWVMALYLEGDRYALFSSPDLKSWTKLCDVPMPGCGECPDFFEMRVEGTKGRRDSGKTLSNRLIDSIELTDHGSRTTDHESRSTTHESRWLFWSANGRYRIGDFDGKTFTPETDPLQADWGPNSYAAQTYSDLPARDGRRIQISWMQGGRYPGMPFNQQMSFPRELTLRETADGPRLSMAPVREIAKLRGKHISKAPFALEPGSSVALGKGDVREVRLRLDRSSTGRLSLSLNGAAVAIDLGKRAVTCLGKEAPLPNGPGAIDLTVLFDRSSVELFACEGRVTMAGCFVPNGDGELTLAYPAGDSIGGSLRVRRLDVWALRSAW